MDLAEARRRLPALAELDDTSFVEAVQELYYPDTPVSTLAAELGVKTPAKEQDGPLTRGWNAVKSSVALSRDLAAGDTDSAAANIAEQARYARDNPGSEASQGLQKAWQDGDGIVGGIKAVGGEIAKDWRESPDALSGARSVYENVKAMGSGIVAQVPNMVLPMAGMIGGAAGGSLAGGPVGAVVGGFTGAAAGNTLVGMSEATQRQLQQAGINPEDTEAVTAYLKAHSGSIIGEAGVKGAVIGAVDTATAGAAHFLLTGPGKQATSRALSALGVDLADKAAVKLAVQTPEFATLIGRDAAYQATRKGGQALARNATAAGLDPAGEFVGEYLGSLAATGDADAKDAFLEAVSSVGQSAIMFGGQKVWAGVTAPRATADDVLAAGSVDEAIAAAQAAVQAPAAPAVAPPAAGQSLTGTDPAALMQRPDSLMDAVREPRSVTGAAAGDLLAGQPQDPLLGPAREGAIQREDQRQDEMAAQAMDRMSREATDDAQALREFPASTLPRKMPTERALPELDEAIQPGDILQKNGALWPEKGAKLKAKSVGGAVVAVKGGFIVRPAVKESAQKVEQAAPAAPPIKAADVTSQPSQAAAAPVPAPAIDPAPAQGQPAGSGTAVVAGGKEQPDAALSVPRRLFVQRGSQRFEVADLKEASQKWQQFQNATGAGVSEVGNGVRVVDQDGNEVARISYNGRVWPPGEWKSGMKPILEADGVNEQTPPNVQDQPSRAPAAAQAASPEASTPARSDATGAAATPASTGAGAVEADGVDQPADNTGPLSGLDADIPLDVAVRAFNGTSHVPEDRGAARRRGYVQALTDAWEKAKAAAGDDPEALARVTEQMERLRDGYRERVLAYLNSHANVASAMIAGPARFPVERNRKRSEAADNKAREADEFLKRGIERLTKAAQAPVDKTPQGELAQLRARLSEREATQQRMKDVNAALRKGDDAMRALGMSDDEIAAAKTPDVMGGVGYPAYRLSNNNAEIHRLRERVAQAETRVSAAAAGPVEREYAGARIEENAQDDRLRLFFDGKPDEAVRTDLKANGFRWSPNAGAWQRQLTNNARAAAKSVLDKHFGAETPALKRSNPTSGMPLDRVRQALAPALDKLTIPYELHASGQAASAATGYDIPAGAKGMYFRGKLHVIAEGIRTEVDAEEVFWHEVQHAGMDAIYGAGSKAYEQALRAIAAQNKNVREAAKRWMERYGKEDYEARVAGGATRERAMLRTKLQAVDEALAELSGRTGEKIAGLSRFLAKVQEFMRAIGLNRLADKLESMTDAQALAMIYRARQAVMGERSQQGQGQLAPAFSQDRASLSQGFVPAPDGSLDYGQITPEMGRAMRREAGRIRLERGDASFGLEHIEKRHGEQIRAIGYPDVQSFVAAALRNIDKIWQPSGTSQLVVVQGEDKGRAVFIQLKAGIDASGDFYTVNTAFPVKGNYGEGRQGWKTLWSRVPVPADASGASDFAGQPPKAGEAAPMDRPQSAGDIVPQPSPDGEPAPNNDGASFLRDPRTIEVNGTRRPIEDSTGRLVGRDFAEQSNFWKWFGESAVTDENGAPLVVYHGTNKTQAGDAFTMFDTYASNYGLMGQGGYFTADPAIASQYTAKGKGDAPTVYAAYLSIKSPLDMNAKADAAAWQKQFPDAESFHESGDTNESWYRAAEDSLRDQELPMYEGAEIMQEGLRAMGFDGITHIGGGRIKADSTPHRVYVAFDPEQVKSATGNNGDYSPDDTRIQFSRASTAPEYLKAAREAVADSITAPGTLSWWHRTIGTPYNLAQRSPAFKRVFDRVQDFLGDVSAFATEAADKATTILPKLESWKDITKTALTAADTKAVGRPVFEGTLAWTRGEDGQPVQVADLERDAEGLSAAAKAQAMLRAGKISQNVLKMWQGLPIEQYEQAVGTRYASQMLRAGIVWTDAELKSMFGLNAAQIALYREFRAATDESIKRLAISDMLRYAGDDADFIRAEVLDAGTVDEAATLLRDQLLQAAQDAPERSEVLTRTANSIMDKADHAQQLMAEGYAPLMRFGQFTVDVVDATGERVYFGLFESKLEAARMAQKMAGEYPQATVSRGTVSQEEYKLFAGVSPETLELFGEMLGLESTGDAAKDRAFQEYLKLAKSNRSSMRRLIHRKGIAGFSEDVGRVLAGFVYSNARQAAANLHMGEITDAANAIPKGQGQLKDAAVKLADYVKNPQEEAQAVRGLLFAQYLGGSLAAAMVNMTQPVQVTMPYLSQFGGIAQAARQMKNAVADVWKKSTGEADLDKALQHAVEQGIVAPQEVHQLMAQAAGRGSLKAGDGTRAGNLAAMGNNAAARLALAWGKFFSSAELFNRRVTFIAAYRVAKAQGMDNPAAFAEMAITETQFVYNKGNRPQWARGALGSTLFTFKTYSISYVELLHRMYTRGGPEGRKAALFGLAMLMLMGGAGGLPFMEDVSDVVDGIAQRMGYNFSLKRSRQQLLQDALGKQMGEFMDKGISGLPGAPLDVSGRLGMGNLIPGTGIFTKKTDHTRDVLEILGPAADFGKRVAQGADQVSEGRPLKGVLTASPTAVRNLAQSWEMATTGQYKDKDGRNVLAVDSLDAAAKAVGFQPNDVARVQEASRDAQSLVNVARMRETEIVNDWAQAMVEGDREGQEAARQAVRDWNAANPDTPIKIKLQQVLKKVQNMRMSKAERIERSAPREVRAAARRELEQAQ